MKNRAFTPKGDLALRPNAIGLTWPQAPRDTETRNGVCVLNISGPLEHRDSPWFDSYESILERYQGAMEDEACCGILLQIDSPGGDVSGLQETVRKMRLLRAEYNKPVYAFADDEAYSAAYAIACAADRIFLPESGGLGSIGVLTSLTDRTQLLKDSGLRVEVVRSGPLKAEGHPDIPLSDETIARVQKRVDGLADMFFQLVSKSRNVPVAKIAALKGGLLYGQRAVNLGLADGISTFDDVLNMLSGTIDTVNSDKPSSQVRNIRMNSTEKRVALALKALMEASTPSARAKCANEYALALSLLTESKIQKSYKKKTVEEEEERDDGKDDDDDGDDDDDEKKDTDKDDDEKDDDKEDDEEERAADSDEDSKEVPVKEKKMKRADSLSAFAKALTGQSSSRAAREVLSSMHDLAQRSSAQAEEIRKLKEIHARTRLEGIIKEGVAAGKIKPAQVAWAQSQSVASLKAYLDVTPALFAPREPGLASSDASESSHEIAEHGLTKAEAEVCRLTGVSVQDFKKHKAAKMPSLPKVN